MTESSAVLNDLPEFDRTSCPGCAQFVPGKLTSLRLQELRDVGPAQDAEADEGLLK